MNINGFKIEHKANDGCNATMFACMNTNVTMIQYLVKEMGADQNTTDRNHRTMVHWACRFGNIGLLKKLLEWKVGYV